MPSTPEPDTDAARLAGRLRLPVTRLARQLRQQDRSGLTPSLTATLATIAHEGPLTLGDLAERERLAKPTITRLVTALEELGFVVRRRDDVDGRVCWVGISPAGQRELDENRWRRTVWLTEQLDQLSAGDLAKLGRAVEVLERLTLGAPTPTSS